MTQSGSKWLNYKIVGQNGPLTPWRGSKWDNGVGQKDSKPNIRGVEGEGGRG